MKDNTDAISCERCGASILKGEAVEYNELYWCRDCCMRSNIEADESNDHSLESFIEDCNTPSDKPDTYMHDLMDRDAERDAKRPTPTERSEGPTLLKEAIQKLWDRLTISDRQPEDPGKYHGRLKPERSWMDWDICRMCNTNKCLVDPTYCVECVNYMLEYDKWSLRLCERQQGR